MAPSKRVRPAFSPPRLRTDKNAAKSKPKSKSKSAASSTGVAKARSAPSKNSSGTNKRTSKSTRKSLETTANRRSRLVSPTPSASDSLGQESEDVSEAMQDNDSEDEPERSTIQATGDSPEPDYILAEISREPAASIETPIPSGLVHRILHSHFDQPEKTKISTDARDVVSKYVEVFVREAIMRCAYEQNEEAQGGSATNQGSGGGWLEVEDLEKVAVQLCLDF